MDGAARAEGEADGYVRNIRKQDYRGLWRLFNQLRDGEPAGWPSGRALEYLILRAFELEGASVTWPYLVNRESVVLEQVDGAVREGDLFCLFESKHWKRPVDFGAIAQMRGKLARRPLMTLGAIFSMEGFTRAATVLARSSSPNNVLLWDADDLSHALERKGMRTGLQKKIRHAVEYGLPYYNLWMGRAP